MAAAANGERNKNIEKKERNERNLCKLCAQQAGESFLPAEISLKTAPKIFDKN